MIEILTILELEQVVTWNTNSFFQETMVSIYEFEKAIKFNLENIF